MDTAEIVAELDSYSGQFPRQALEEAVARREELTPQLIAIVERAVAAARATDEDAWEEVWPVPAICLLAQFREERAFRPLLALAAAERHEALDCLLGDLITDGLNRVLAAVSGGQTGPLMELAADERAEPYVRGAAMEALVGLVADGRRSREEVVELLAGLLRGGLKRRRSPVWFSLVNVLVALNAGELRDELQQVFAEGLYDDDFAAWDNFEADLLRDRTEALAELPERYPPIEAVRELEGWACFREKPAGSPAWSERGEFDLDDDEAEDLDEDADGDEGLGGPERIVREAPKVGRNAPCPCGSGKKYKRCCGK